MKKKYKRKFHLAPESERRIPKLFSPYNHGLLDAVSSQLESNTMLFYPCVPWEPLHRSRDHLS